mmetsp:Transcript_147011/g.273753  ORF Transcript_147011/g.273753 Transcript_147011/m.273753 type:complete len:147 (-) Transcript_147011:58-498(-)
MVRPVVYNPLKAFNLSAEETQKYKAIAQGLKEMTVDAQAATGRVDIALAAVSKAAVEDWDPVPDVNLDSTSAEWDDFVDSKDPEYVGIMLDGCSGSAIVDGELDADTEDIHMEEPQVVAEEEEDEEDERSLWGDGEADPQEAGGDE